MTVKCAAGLVVLFFFTSINLHGQIIKDTVKPTITFMGPDSVFCEVHYSYADSGVILSDNYYSDSILRKNLIVQTTVDTSSVGSYSVIYILTDPSGNGPVVAKRTVFVGDTISPFLVLKGADTTALCRWCPYIDSGYVLSDNYWSGDFITIKKEGTFLQSQGLLSGLYFLRYVATDKSGNVGYSEKRWIAVSECITQNPCGTGIHTSSGNAFDLAFPSPTTGSLYVTEDPIQSSTKYLIDQSGKMVLCAEDSNKQVSTLDLSGLSNGMYILVVKRDKQLFTQKIILQKPGH